MVEIFNRYLIDLNQQRAENGTLMKEQVKVLGERAWLIIKSFRYIGKLSTRSAELGFYITKLVKATEFDPQIIVQSNLSRANIRVKIRVCRNSK